MTRNELNTLKEKYIKRSKINGITLKQLVESLNKSKKINMLAEDRRDYVEADDVDVCNGKHTIRIKKYTDNDVLYYEWHSIDKNRTRDEKGHDLQSREACIEDAEEYYANNIPPAKALESTKLNVGANTIKICKYTQDGKLHWEWFVNNSNYDDWLLNHTEFPSYEKALEDAYKFYNIPYDSKSITTESMKFLKDMLKESVTQIIKETWVGHLHDEYDSFEEFEEYDSMYNLAQRLGYDDAECAWLANPKVTGSTDPEAYKTVNESLANEDLVSEYKIII